MNLKMFKHLHIAQHYHLMYQLHAHSHYQVHLKQIKFYISLIYQIKKDFKSYLTMGLIIDI